MADLLAKISALTIKMSTAPQTQSAERVVRASSKVTPHHNESDQSDTSVAREHVWFSQNIARTLTNEQYWTHVKNDVLPRSQPFFLRGLQSTTSANKMSPRHPKCCTCHTESSSCPKWRQFHKTRLSNTFNPFKTSSKFIKYHACHETWPPKPPLILTCKKCHNCHADEKVSDVMHLSRKTTC